MNTARASTASEREEEEELRVLKYLEKDFLLESEDENDEDTATENRKVPRPSSRTGSWRGDDDGPDQRQRRRSGSFPRCVLVASLIVNMVLLCTCTYLGLKLLRFQHVDDERGPDPRLGFATDLEDVRSLIRYEERPFTGALVYNKTRNVIERIMDAEVQYFGPPEPRIDEAWERLLGEEWLVMTDEEAEPFGEELRVVPGRKSKVFELAVTHNLHCLNAMRKMLDADYYEAQKTEAEKSLDSHAPKGYARAHMDHCLDMLFQDTTCHVDMTPAPLYYWNNSPIAFGRSKSRVCRNFESVLSWHDRRLEQYPS